MSTKTSISSVTEASSPTTEHYSFFTEALQLPNQVQNGSTDPNLDNLGLDDVSSSSTSDFDIGCKLLSNVDESLVFGFPIEPTEAAYMAGASDMFLTMQREWNEIWSFANDCTLSSNCSELLLFGTPIDPNETAGYEEDWKNSYSFEHSSPKEIQNPHHPDSVANSLGFPPLDRGSFPYAPELTHSGNQAFEELIDLAGDCFLDCSYFSDTSSLPSDITPESEIWDQFPKPRSGSLTASEALQVVTMEGTEIDRAPIDRTEDSKASLEDKFVNQTIREQLSSGLPPISEHHEDIEITGSRDRKISKKQPTQSRKNIGEQHSRPLRKMSEGQMDLD